MNLSQRHMVLVVLAVLLFVVAGLMVSAPLRASAQLDQTRKGEWSGLSSVAEVLLSGAAGGVIVFVLTTTAGAVVRARQRGRELVGLSRVIRPEMERNCDALEILERLNKQGVLDLDVYQLQHPIYEAWYDTRTKLAQLMPAHDFATLANFHEELELLDSNMLRSEASGAAHVEARRLLRSGCNQRMDVMTVIDGYAYARWNFFKGWVPADL